MEKLNVMVLKLDHKLNLLVAEVKLFCVHGIEGLLKKIFYVGNSESVDVLREHGEVGLDFRVIHFGEPGVFDHLIYLVAV